jgi:hypothetical protein
MALLVSPVQIPLIHRPSVRPRTPLPPCVGLISIATRARNMLAVHL